MFIRQVKKQNSKTGKTFFQYQLIQAARINGVPRHRNILFLGSDPILENAVTRKQVAELLESKIYQVKTMFNTSIDLAVLDLVEVLYLKYQEKYQHDSIEAVLTKPPLSKNANYQDIDLNDIDLNEVRTVGAERLCLEIIRWIGLDKFLEENMYWKDQQVNTALISIISRAVFSCSEHKTAQYLIDNSALCELLELEAGSVTRYHLYEASDRLYAAKDQIDKYLYERVLDLFNLDDKLVIYDLSNSYFEGQKKGSSIAQFGRSKEKRNDCKQVVFTGVINSQGFIRHSKIYEGNKADTDTLKDMIQDLNKHCPSTSRRTVVMDAGIASEENLAYLKANQYDYICVARNRIKDYEINLSQQRIHINDQHGNPIELAMLEPTDETGGDRYLYVNSTQKAAKEKSMQDKLSQRFEQDIQQIIQSIAKKGGLKKIEKVWERIGRVKEKYTRVHALYDISVEHVDNIVTQITCVRKSNDKTAARHGIYFIRTNIQQTDEAAIWQIYNTIREVESTFRCLKSDLDIRPVFHQKDERVKAHIYLTILAYQIVNTIRYMLQQNNIHHDWQNIKRIMKSQVMANIELKNPKRTIRIRQMSTPSEQAKLIYKATGIPEKNRKKKKDVVYF